MSFSSTVLMLYAVAMATMVAVCHGITRYTFPDGLMVREAEGCTDEEITLACHSYQSIVMTQALVYSRIMASRGGCEVPPYNRQHSRESVLHYLNRKCSGEQRCHFKLKEDVPGAAGNFSYWQGAIVVASYTCVNESSWNAGCGSESTELRGWLKSPGYPKFYLGTEPCNANIQLDPTQEIVIIFPDIHLKELVSGCKDHLTVSDSTGILTKKCGTIHEPLRIKSAQHSINVTLYATNELVPARGFIAYYVALGCPSPPVPSNSTVKYRNGTHALLECNDGYVFFTEDRFIQKRTSTHCYQQVWSEPFQCHDLSELLDSGNITEAEYNLYYNASTYERFSDTEGSTKSIVLDLVVPAVVMSGLVLGNIFILLIILRCRRKSTEETCGEEWDSIKSNPEPTDVRDPVAPSRV